jgi:hypothetical protein
MAEKPAVPAKKTLISNVYPKELKDYARALYIQGYGSRQTRRILMQKWDEVPESRVIRYWYATYTKDIKALRDTTQETSLLAALQAEEELVEDRSDDVMFGLQPLINSAFKEGMFDDYDKLELLKVYLKENNDRGKRANTKIMRLDPNVSNVTAFQIFIDTAKKKAEAQHNGNASDATVIDVSPEQG